MKRCFKCKTKKPLGEFYQHPMMADGHLGKCKVCARRDVRTNYAKRRDQYHEYEHRRYRDNPKRRDGIERAQRKYPAKHRARVHLHNAVARGKIKKGRCEKCGARKVDGHHEDYSRPLEVRWLCRKHHMELHRLEQPNG